MCDNKLLSLTGCAVLFTPGDTGATGGTGATGNTGQMNIFVKYIKAAAAAAAAAAAETPTTAMQPDTTTEPPCVGPAGDH